MYKSEVKFCKVLSEIIADRIENKVALPSGIARNDLNITTESGHLTMSLIQNELFLINPETSQGRR